MQASRTPKVKVSSSQASNLNIAGGGGGSSGEGGSSNHSNPSTPPVAVRSVTPQPGSTPPCKMTSSNAALALATSSAASSTKQEYKAQRSTYRKEKKRLAGELTSALRDPSIIIMHDWLKVRGTLKGWTKLWCVLKPGHLLLYKTPKTKVSADIILIRQCTSMEMTVRTWTHRPSISCGVDANNSCYHSPKSPNALTL